MAQLLNFPNYSVSLLYSRSNPMFARYILSQQSYQHLSLSVWTNLRNSIVNNLKTQIFPSEIMYKAGLHSIVHVTAPSIEVAKTLAHGIIKNNLAACVNVMPNITSIYKWKGEINEDSETLMIIKTRTSRVEELTNYVKSNHPYEVCEVISTKIENGNNPYLDWISESVPAVKVENNSEEISEK